MIHTYPIEQVAEEHLPQEWTPAYRIRWMRERLNRGEISGIRIGRGKWRMTDTDIQDMLDKRRNTTPTEVDGAQAVPLLEGLSARAKRRLTA